MMVRAFVLVGLVAIVGVAVASTVEHEGNGDKREARKELRERIGTWARTNVLPTLKDWKARLDGAMSSDDLAKLNDLRSRAAALHTEMRSAKEALHTARKSGDESAMTAARERMQSLRTQSRTIMEELRPLIEEYRPTLQQIRDDAKPVVQGWLTEVRGIARTWAEENGGEAGEGRCGMRGMHKNIPGLEMLSGGGCGGHAKMAARFMLWNGGDEVIDHQAAPAPGVPDIE